MHILKTPTESENVRLYRYIKSLGAIYGRWLYFQERICRNPRVIRVRYKARELWLRLNTTDILVLFTVFYRQDYAMNPSTLPRVIVDAGAYTGYTAIYFAEKFPTAKIIAIEPVPSNFELLKKNTSNYPQIFPINKALWYQNTRLQIHDQSTGHWGYTVAENTAPTSNLGEIDAITINDIMQEFKINQIDLLKVDIEGAEKEIFEHCQPWIANIGIIAIELHDRIKEMSSQVFYAATRDFEFERKNDMTVFKSRVGIV